MDASIPDTRGPILLVEDDRDIRESLAEVLADEGVSVLAAEDGAEALALLEQNGDARPRLVILDLMMPRMSGWEFRDELRKRRADDIPIVVLSGAPDVTVSAKAFGAADALGKPISLDRLLEVVGRFV